MLMKKAILLTALLCLSNLLPAQDLITKTNGEEIKAKVLEISPTEIKYKRFDYQQGPTIIIPISEVFMLKYPNGEKQVFEKNLSTTQAANQSLSTTAVPEGYVALTAGTSISLELQETISSKIIYEGQRVQFKVKADLIQNGLLLVRAGEVLFGTVVKAEKASELGKEGQLHIRVDQVPATDGQQIPLSGNKYKDGENRSKESIGIAALIFWPALFMKGKEAEIPAGSIFNADVAQTMFFKIP